MTGSSAPGNVIGQRASRHERRRFAKLPATSRDRLVLGGDAEVGPNSGANAPTGLPNRALGGTFIVDGQPYGGCPLMAQLNVPMLVEIADMVADEYAARFKGKRPFRPIKVIIVPSPTPPTC